MDDSEQAKHRARLRAAIEARRNLRGRPDETLRTSRALHWLPTLWSAAWFGGELLNALMVVPHFSRTAPDSLTAWGEMRFDNLADFFVIFAPLWTFVALLITAVLSKDHPTRRWIMFSAVCALVSLMSLLGWMVPT